MARNSSNLEKGLECPVCMDLFKNARYLSCSHTFCAECIDNLAIGQTDVFCPECRQKTVLDKSTGAKGLNPNIAINRLIEALCDSEPVSSDADDQYSCQVHPKQMKKYFCKECKALVCSECSLEKHIQHASEICPARDIANERKSSMNVLLHASEEKVKQHQEVLQLLEERFGRNIQPIRSGAAELKSRIDASFAALVDLQQMYGDRICEVKDAHAELMRKRLDINEMGRTLLANGNPMDIIFVLQQWSDAVRDIDSVESPDIGFTERDEEVMIEAASGCLFHVKTLAALLEEFTGRSSTVSSSRDSSSLVVRLPANEEDDNAGRDWGLSDSEEDC